MALTAEERRRRGLSPYGEESVVAEEDLSPYRPELSPYLKGIPGVDEELDRDEGPPLDQDPFRKDYGGAPFVSPELDLTQPATEDITPMETFNPYLGEPPGISIEQLRDPTMRNFIQSNLRELVNRGDLSAQADEERRLAREGISAFGQAEFQEFMPEIEAGMQKRGLLTSGETGRRQIKRTSETVLKEQALLADIERDILSRYGGYKQERERAYLGAGVEMEKLASQEAMTTMGLALQSWQTQVTSQKDLQIAEIQRNTTLSAKDKDAMIAKINGEYSKLTSIISGEYGVETTLINADTARAIAQLGFDAQVYVADNAAAMQALALSITEMTPEGKPRWMEELEQATKNEMFTDPITGEQTPWSTIIARERISGEIAITDMNNEANMDLMIEQINSAEAMQIIDRDTKILLAQQAISAEWGLTRLNNSFQMSMALKDINERARQFDLSRQQEWDLTIKLLEQRDAELELAGLAQEANFIMTLLSDPVMESLTDEQVALLANRMYNIIADETTDIETIDPKDLLADIAAAEAAEPDYTEDSLSTAEWSLKAQEGTLDAWIEEMIDKYDKPWSEIKEFLMP